MDLGKTTTIVRPRSKWQALDLGFKMATQWYRPLIYSWIMVSMPLFLLLHLLLPSQQYWIAMFVVWWLKPIWERVQLGYLSYAQFGETSTLKQLFKRWLSVASKQMLAVLLWRRLSLRRSYSAPVVQLENLSGKRRQKRLQSFEGDNQQAAIWLTIVLVHLELFITLSVYALIMFLVPADAKIDLTFFDLLEQFSFGDNLLVYFSWALISPFFVASGFSLYLNQRTHIEGWDIEITFRRMVKRQQQKRRTSPALMTAILCFILSSSAFTTVDSLAAEQSTTNTVNQTSVETTPEQRSPEQKSAYDLAQKIAASEHFNKIETTRYPEFYLNLSVDEDKQESMFSAGWLAGLLQFFAGSIELLLTAVVIAIILLLAYRYRYWLAQFTPGSDTTQSAIDNKPTSVFGLDIDVHTLGNNPVGDAKALWQQGNKRQSLSLLYRGSLLNLVNNQHLSVHNSYTEGECLAQVKHNADAQTFDYFQQLTRIWQRLAYAGIMPGEQDMAQLFSQWHDVFSEPADES